MELDYGWASLDDAFIFRVVQVLSSPSSLINVCRPATAILKKLVEADPASAPGPQAGSSKSGPAIVPGSVYRYGFTVVFEQMRKEKSLLETVVSRLGSADTAMAQYRCGTVSRLILVSNLAFSMMLINSLLSHASDLRWEEFLVEMERLNIRRAVVVCKFFLERNIRLMYRCLQRLMSQHTMEDLTSCILDFQANMLRVTYRKKSTPVDLEAQPSHVADLQFIWTYSRLIEEVDEKGQQLKWRKLGFDTEDIETEFNDVGVLGLECLVRASPNIL